MKNRLERPIHVRGYDEPGKDQVTVFFLPGYGYAEDRLDVPDYLLSRTAWNRIKGGNGSGISVSVMATVVACGFLSGDETLSGPGFRPMRNPRGRKPAYPAGVVLPELRPGR